VSVQTEPAPAGVQTQPKKRGRPKGSKNKPRKKAGQEQLPEQLQQEPAELLTVTSGPDGMQHPWVMNEGRPYLIAGELLVRVA
jgi:hypothetical protein